ncbi:uncharacterized protein LOC116015227 [Ipomoea triloba]|uniref:uncharacterized protein LOC116015227 n=1 Tax=Ipomoea triloba TaxID=35885 RepID=UPI00125CF7E9|nr:uncharacterized protein LOC116015227 [Ipomoea triloba]XP_031111113.1 uncharacterized protein LOC116015227 [Ipomoea triloba]XP_031111114.1 uncharacterized protein LOC116015227 [Ipomoea triloba]
MGSQSQSAYWVGVQKVHDIVKSLTLDQQRAVKDMGFDGILSVENFNIDEEFLEFLIDLVDYNNVSISIQGANHQITHQDVGSILGVPSSGFDVEEMIGLEGGSYPVPVRDGMIDAAALENMIALERGGATDAFKTYFLLYVVTYFLAPGHGLNKKWSNIAQHLHRVGEMNWSKFVLDCLLDSITRARQMKQHGVGGCLVLLMIYFLEKYRFRGDKRVDYELRPTPRIKDWGKDELGNRIREFKRHGLILASSTVYSVNIAERDNTEFNHIDDYCKQQFRALEARQRDQQSQMESFKEDVTQKLDSIMDLLRNPMSRTANPISPSEVKEPTQINPKQSMDVDRVKKRKWGSDDNPFLEWFFQEKRSGTYVSFENGHVNGDGLYSLRPGVWIIDEVINAHECVLRFKDCDKAPRNLYLPTYFAQLPEDERYNVFQRCVGSNRTLSRCTSIYIPMNMENRHWYLIRADIQTKEAAIFDSYLQNKKAKTRTHEAEEVLKSLHNCLIEHAMVDESFSYSDDKNGVWKISIPGWVPQQKNGYDCGVFVMLFMEQGKNLTRETRFETEKERRRIALQLLYHPGNERRSQVMKMLSSTLGGDQLGLVHKKNKGTLGS